MSTNQSRSSAPAIVAIVAVIAGVLWIVMQAIVSSRVVLGPAVIPASEKVSGRDKTAAVVAVDEAVLVDESVSVFLSNFYAAYADADAERLASYFTLDRTTEDAATYKQLFLGDETSKLFLASNASEKVSGHTLTAAEKEQVGWKLTIKEDRVDRAGRDIPSVTTTMMLVQAPVGTGGWLVASYARLGASGTYEALVTPQQ